MYAQGPNILNLNAYVNEEGEQNYDNGHDQEDNFDSQAIEQQFEDFVKDIQKYDEIISKVGQNVEDVSAQEYFITDFYPNFVFETTYEMDEQKRIIAYTDPQMAKLMENLERNNKNLKEQLKSWLFQYSKKTRLTQVLLTQNKVLRKYVSQKNKEIIKLINSIHNAENEELVQLKQNLNQLKQENGVLLAHLKAIKDQLKDKEDEQKKIIAAYDKSERERLQIEGKITLGEDEEEHYSKMVALLEDSIHDSKRREKHLLQEKTRLEKLKKQYLKDEEMIEKQIQSCQIDRADIENHLKRKFKGHQSQKERIMDDIEDITEKIQKSKQTTKQYQQEIGKNEYKINQYSQICKGLDKKISDVDENVKTGKKQLEEILNTETQYLSDIDMINFDIDVLKDELKELTEREENNQNQFKREIKNLQEDKKNEVSKWTAKLTKTQKQVSKRILNEKSDLAVKKKEVEEMQRRVQDKKLEITYLREQMKEIKENQAQVTSLRQKLKEAERD